MVMETPSPQCVGLEFVRQYYTVLNKAPMHLHRFYSHNSLFMHGGPNNVNDPTVGQADIHKKIVTLNFQDCHAKIRMVDAHATLGSGVVIQVVGELSNNGMPMRRFMQTFVLAPQTPKKYYVHNDIFRYQDEVFFDGDEEPTDEGNSEAEEDIENVDDSNYSSNSTSATINGTSHHHNHHHRERDSSPVITPSNPNQAHIQSPAQVTPVSTPAPAPVQIPASSPVVTPAPIPSEPRPSTPPAAAETEAWTAKTSAPPPPQSEEWKDPVEEKPVAPVKKEAPAKVTQPETVHKPVIQAPPPPRSDEPKTFANLFKKQSYTQTSSPPISSTVQPRIQESTSHGNANTSQSYSTQSARSESANRPPAVSVSTQSSSAQSTRLSRFYHDEDKRKPGVPDCQQVFVGNLPHTIGEEQLRSEFTQYGKILEIRINTGKGKAGAKGPGGHQVPNFGFIAFEDESSVQKCLGSRPIFLNGDSRINVEEKKARGRMEGGMGGGGRPNSGRGGMNSGGGGMRGGSQGGRGGGGRGTFSRDNSRGGSSSNRGGGNSGGGYMQRR